LALFRNLKYCTELCYWCTVCNGFTPCFPYMWRFPYPFGFCNPVGISGRKLMMMMTTDSRHKHTYVINLTSSLTKKPIQ